MARYVALRRQNYIKHAVASPKGHLFPSFVGLRVRSLIIATSIKCFYHVHRSVSRSGRALASPTMHEEVHEGQRAITYNRNSSLGHEIANLVSKDVIRRKYRGFIKRRRCLDAFAYEPQLLPN